MPLLETMTKTKNRRKLFRVGIVGLLLLSCWVGISFYWYSANGRASDLALRRKLVGTWVGELGNVINFRSDGTARSRSADSTGVEYLEWTTSKYELRMFQFTRKQKYRMMISRYVLGQFSYRFEILETSDDQIELLDYSTGSRFKLNKTSDSLVEDSP